MDVQDIIDLVQKSEFFKTWKETHSHAYLAHLFFEQEQCQVGYFDHSTEKMTTFFLQEENVIESQESEVFKEPGKKILFLDIAKVHINPQKALSLAKKVQEENYHGEMVFKSFTILQHLEIGQVFNITLVTQAMKTINIKLSTETGAALQHHISSLMDMARTEE